MRGVIISILSRLPTIWSRTPRSKIPARRCLCHPLSAPTRPCPSSGSRRTSATRAAPVHRRLPPPTRWDVLSSRLPPLPPRRSVWPCRKRCSLSCHSPVYVFSFSLWWSGLWSSCKPFQENSNSGNGARRSPVRKNSVS